MSSSRDPSVDHQADKVKPTRAHWPATAVRIISPVIVLLAGAWLLYFSLATMVMPDQIEYREGAAQVVTQLLLEGRNPFALENQPLGMTNYGILFSLTAWPLAMAFGNTLILHRAITIAFLLLSAYVVGRTAFFASKQAVLSLAAAILAAAALATRGGLGAYPSSMGAFFFLSATAVPYLRGFDRRGLLLSGVLCLLALYSKPYFVLGFAIVAGYAFLFVSKKSGLLYGLGFAAAAGISALLVRETLPLYFYDTVFSNLAHTAEPDPGHVTRQLRQFAVELLPLIVAGLMLGATRLAARRTEARVAPRLVNWAQVRAPEKPLFALPVHYFAWASVCTLLAFVLILGPHPENYMNYLYQLLLPMFLLWLAEALRRQHALMPVVNALLLLNLTVFSLARLAPADLQQPTESHGAWAALYRHMDACEVPLNSPTTAAYLVQHDKWPIDSGHTEYFFGAQPYPGMSWFGPEPEVIDGIGTGFLRDLRAAVAHGDFDCITLARHSAWPRNLPLERGGYTLADSVMVSMAQTDQTWQIDIWLPAAK
jgi:hypothetical protein